MIQIEKQSLRYFAAFLSLFLSRTLATDAHRLFISITLNMVESLSTCGASLRFPFRAVFSLHAHLNVVLFFTAVQTWKWKITTDRLQVAFFAVSSFPNHTCSDFKCLNYSICGKIDSFFPPYCLITCFIYSEGKSSHYRSPSGGLNWSCCFNSDSTWDCGFCLFVCLGSRLQCGGCRGEDSAVQTSTRLRAVAAAADRLRRAAGWRPHWGHRFRLVFEVYRGRWTVGEIWWYYVYLICLGDI